MPIDIETLPNGDLQVSADEETRAWLAEDNPDFWSALSEMFAPFSENGSYTPFDAGDANPFVGLTTAPCIAESMGYPDNGQREVIGRLWWFPDYMVRCPLDDLRDTGQTVFTLAE